MRNARKLSLKREALTQLSAGEMSSVAGGSHGCTAAGCTGEVTHRLCPSLEVCPTFPVLECIDTVLCVCSSV